ncbi:MAG: ComEC family competence protein, partial [Desulfobulbus sp.]|nr:ComEC family competence protein [Desulfobulbus sp.]
MNRLVRLCSDNLLISVVVCYMAGAACASLFNGSLSKLPVNVIAPALLAFCLVFVPAISPRHRFLVTLPFFVVTGGLHTHGALQPVTDSYHIANNISQPVRVTLVGHIATMRETNSEHTRFTLDCESILFHGHDRSAGFQPVRGRVLLFLRNGMGPQYVPGTKIMAIATVDRVRNYQTPGAFDYRLQMASRGIHCTGWIGSQQEITPLADAQMSLWQTIRYSLERVRQNTADFLSQNLPGHVSGIYQALLIGSMAHISPDIIEAFKGNGCFHILCISGLHFSLLGFFCVGVFTFILKRSTWLLVNTHVPTVALCLTAPILILYTFIAGVNIPTVRSLVTALLVLYAVLLRRQQTFVHLIAAAALVVLAVNPPALFTPSFQLSFAAVLSINLVYPRLPLFIKDPPARSNTNPVAKALRFVQSMLYVSIAATVGTLPFMLYHFNRVSVVGPVMNLFIEPLLCLWALPFGLLAVPLISFAPDLALLLLESGRPGISLALWLSALIAGFPYTSLWTITPHISEIIIFFTVAFLLFRSRSTFVDRVCALALAVVLLGSFTFSLWFREKNRSLTV